MKCSLKLKGPSESKWLNQLAAATLFIISAFPFGTLPFFSLR
jgi:hypothetical protein